MKHSSYLRDVSTSLNMTGTCVTRQTVIPSALYCHSAPPVIPSLSRNPVLSFRACRGIPSCHSELAEKSRPVIPSLSRNLVKHSRCLRDVSTSLNMTGAGVTRQTVIPSALSFRAPCHSELAEESRPVIPSLPRNPVLSFRACRGIPSEHKRMPTETVGILFYLQ